MYQAILQGSVVAPSDKRLKQDIASISDALSIVSQLTPKTYNYKSEKVKAHGLPTVLQYGFIAQEVEEVLPSIVHDQVTQSDD